MKIGYGLLLSDPYFNYVRKVQISLLENFGIKLGLEQFPHVTIKAPFDCNEIEPFLAYAQGIASTTKEFDIKFTGYGTFKSNVLYLRATPSEKMTTLHNRILDDMRRLYNIQPHKFEGDNIIFHLSLALQDLDEHNISNIIESLPNLDNFVAPAIGIGTLLYMNQDVEWELIQMNRFSE